MLFAKGYEQGRLDLSKRNVTRVGGGGEGRDAAFGTCGSLLAPFLEPHPLLGPPVRAETSTSSQERNLHIFSPQLFLYQHRTQQVSFGWLLGPNKFQLVTCWPSVLV